MRIHFIFLLAMLADTCPLAAASRQFPEYNFSIELPAGWKDIDPIVPLALFTVQSPDQSRWINVIVDKSTGRNRAALAREIRADARKDFSEDHWQIGPDKPVTINGNFFTAFVAKHPPGASMAIYIAATDTEVYTLQTFGRDAEDDAELQSIVQSFRLLTPEASLPLDTPANSVVYHYPFGRMLATTIFGVGVFGFPSLVIWLFVRLSSKRKAG